MRNLTVDQKLYIEQYISNEKKSLIVAYILWFFLGAVGAHRFYVGKTITGILMIVVLIISGILTLVTFGLATAVTMLPITIWWVIDAVLVIFMIKNYNRRLRREAMKSIAR